MVKRLLFLFFILSSTTLCLAQTAVPTPVLTAYVDRNEVSLNDVITLTIRVGSQLGEASPSLNGLNRDFEQIGISRSNTYTNNNGNVQSWTEYRISLRAKSTGTLTIPTFRVSGEVSNPITITVGDADPNSSPTNSEIFLNSSISKNDVYVQEQLIYTVKLYYTLGFDQGAQLTSPQVGNAVVQQLGSDDSYQEIVDGIRYNVTERKFVIYPQASGELTIPPVYFTATVGRRRSGLSRILNNRSSTAREINLISDPHVINVMEMPADFPGKTWLPAAQLSIVEDWSNTLDNLEIGESITRNIVVVASGLSSSLLQNFEYPDIPNIKFYPDQPLREDISDENGITGTHSEGTAIVPSEVGEFTIPEVAIPWWNTVTNTLEIARVPARTLNVLPGVLSQSGGQAPVTFDPTTTPDSTGSAMVPASQTSGLYLSWIMATVIFASAWLLTTILWLRGRQVIKQYSREQSLEQSQSQSEPQDQERHQAQVTTLPESTPDLISPFSSPYGPLDPGPAYKALQKVCQDDPENIVAIRSATLAWGRAFCREPRILTLESLHQHCRNTELSGALETLEKNLYSESSLGDAVDPQYLLHTIANLQKQAKKGLSSKEADFSLPPLYKN